MSRVITPAAPTQHITATIYLAGEQECAFSSHGDGKNSAGSHIIVGNGDYLIYLHHQDAVRTYAGAWLSKHTEAMAVGLPTSAPLPGNLRTLPGQPPALAIHATGHDTRTTWPDRNALTVRIGRVTWICRDRQAFAGQQQIWRTVIALARVMLPDRPDLLALHH